MRCLYCGKELALLKRLTGGGEFCSDAHKQSYQEEYNRLALSRLLQAQSKSGDKKPAEAKAAKTAGGSKTAAPAAAPVAVEEPVVQEEVAEPVITRTARKQAPPIEPPAPPPPFDPPDMAGFFAPKLTIAFLPEAGSPYVERWLDSASAPSTPEWQFQDGSFTLPVGQLLPLDIHPGVWQKEIEGIKLDAAAQEFTNGRLSMDLPFSPESTHTLEHAGPLVLDIQPVVTELLERRVDDGAAFEWPVEYRTSTILERSQTAIKFSADGDVTEESAATEAPAAETVVVEEEVPEAEVAEIPAPEAPIMELAQSIAEPAPLVEEVSDPVAAETDASPRAALEALSRLHQDMVDREEAVPQSKERKESKRAEEAPEEPKPVEEPAAENEAQPVGFLTIPLKTFSPSKAAVMVTTDALFTSTNPVLPRLKGLPLRPKVSMAPPGFTQPGRAVPSRSPLTEAKLKSAPGPTRTDVQRKPLTRPAMETKAAAEMVEPLKPQPPAKAEAPAPARPVEPKQERQQERTVTPPAAKAPAKPAQAEPKPSKPAQAESRPAESKPVESKIAESKPAESKPAESKPAVPKPAPSKPSQMREPVRPRKDPVTPPPAAVEPPEKQPTLTFESLELQLMANTKEPIWASLKFKLGIAIVLVVVIGITYFALGGKSQKPANGATADFVGPSIMMGEGGWVQNWAGDTQGSHAGRQITIYRPSLSLSDYRIEFQGQIDNKSLGWVFRAADPDNYYAMKLSTVSTGLPLKVALIKYMILHGRETELGRIPLDISVTGETVFVVRMDVRGPRINTYIQGQQVDTWTNDQLKSGGVGFLNERAERGKIKNVSISYLNGVDK